MVVNHIYYFYFSNTPTPPQFFLFCSIIIGLVQSSIMVSNEIMRNSFYRNLSVGESLYRRGIEQVLTLRLGDCEAGWGGSNWSL